MIGVQYSTVGGNYYALVFSLMRAPFPPKKTLERPRSARRRLQCRILDLAKVTFLPFSILPLTFLSTAQK